MENRKRVKLICTDPSLTMQYFKDECDVNLILKKHAQTGVIDHLNNQPAKYEDYSNLVDYQSALNTVMAAQEAFNTLPSDIRSKFQNDPAEFIKFAENKNNLDEMRKMGLAKPLENKPLSNETATITES